MLRPALRYVALMVAVFAATLSAAEPLPIRDFFKPSEFTGAVISPNGKFIAARARLPAAPDATNIVVINLDSKKTQVITGYKQADVGNLSWLNNDRLIFTLTKGVDDGNRRAQDAGLFTIGRDGKRGRSLQQQDGRSTDRTNAKGSERTPQVLDLLPGDDEHILVLLNEQRYLYPDVYRMRVKNGSVKKVQANFANVRTWLADNAGVVRMALSDRREAKDGMVDLYYRDSEDDDWRVVSTLLEDDIRLHGFAPDNKSVFVSSRTDSDRFALYQADPRTMTLGEPIVADPVYDVTGRLYGTVNGQPMFLRYSADTPRTVFFDGTWQSIQTAIDQALPETDNLLVPAPGNNKRVLVYARSSREPGRYYLFDRKNNKLSDVLATRSWIDPDKMADMRPIEFEARDGETIHGYLTMPVGQPKGAPIIVHPHGGPYGIRDRWRYNAEIQFLANRGYGVLQVNYRGSGGYGKRFQRMAHKQWGLQMQDDLTDAAHWALDNGYVDGERIAIYGASYGGYATMMGVTKTPDLYKAGINYVGVVDLERQIRHWRTGYNVAGLTDLMDAFVLEAIGDWNDPTDIARLRDTSPINHVDKIKVPLLVIHGRLDSRVDIHQYEMLISELKKQDKEFKGIMKRHEGHGFYAEENNVELYTEIESFLDANL